MNPETDRCTFSGLTATTPTPPRRKSSVNYDLVDISVHTLWTKTEPHPIDIRSVSGYNTSVLNGTVP